jgi:hypothetical protein
MYECHGSWSENANPAPVPKPLVWEELNNFDSAKANSAFGEYWVTAAERQTKFWWRSTGNNYSPCDSIEHGKSLCESDYQRLFREMCESKEMISE